MSKYNVKKAPETTVSHEGAKVFKLKDEMALFSLLSTGIDKSFYEKADDREKRLVELINVVAAKDPLLAAQMLVYARQKMGQRTVTHRGAVAIAPFVKYKKWAKAFYSKRDKKLNKGGIIYRLDDINEIAACYFHLNPKANLTNAMKKGFRLALEEADRYELAKYQQSGNVISLVDIVNLVHPIPTEKNIKAFEELMNGTLKQFNTVEDKNTKAGQEVAAKVKAGEITKEEAQVELKEAKADNFEELITSRKIGYMALLRNLRNILKASNDLIDKAGALLTDEKMIKQSLVFPHQIDLAVEVIFDEFQTPAGRRLMRYIDEAYEISTKNVKELGFDEHTAVVIDTSGSMFTDGNSSWGFGTLHINGKKSNKMPVEKGALIGATLAKGVDADLYQFATLTSAVKYSPLDSVNSIKNIVLRQQGRVGHGTDIDGIFKHIANKYYSRIFIITDGQSATSTITRSSAYNKYVKKHGQPYIYYIDLCGYGRTPVNMNNPHIHFLTGYSAQIYETAKNYEIDPEALIKEIRAIRF